VASYRALDTAAHGGLESMPEKKRSSSVERMTHLMREAIGVQSVKLQYASVVGVGNGPPDEGGNQRAISETIREMSMTRMTHEGGGR
jgi:hypothetical protein